MPSSARSFRNSPSCVGKKTHHCTRVSSSARKNFSASRSLRNSFPRSGLLFSRRCASNGAMADETPPSLPQQPTPVATAQRTEPLAIWSLLLSIVSWFGCLFLTVIPAIICGHVARKRIRKSNGALGGMNMALVALILAYVQIPFGILGGIMLADMIRSERVRLHELAVSKKEIASDDG